MSKLSVERQAAEDRMAERYANWIVNGPPLDWAKDGLERLTWREVNRRIIETWSMSALTRVKVRAWRIVEGKE